MRLLLLVLVLVLLSGGSAHAQNWALLNPDYKYNYSNDGSDTISNHVFVMDVQPIGTDSFLYALNPIAQACAPCIDVPVSCDVNAGLHVGRPQVFGLSAIMHGSQWTLIGDDSLLVEAAATTGTSWMGSGGIQGTVSSMMEEDLFGQLDSVKQIDFSNGASIKISKAHGVRSFAANGASYALVGVQGGLDAGERFPELIDLFDYQPGDILQYHGNDDHTDGFCYYTTIRTKKYEVLSRTDLMGHTDYSVHIVQGYQTWATPVSGSGGCFSTSGGYEDIISLGIDHDQWTEANFLGSCWLDQLWPKAFAEPLTSGAFAGEFGSNYAGSQWRAYQNEQGRYVMEPEELRPDQPGMWPTVSACFDDSSYWPEYWDQIMGRYVEGIGRVSGHYMGFEHFSEDTLEAYLIGGQEFGEITPDDIILSVCEPAAISTPVITPVPADDRIVLTGARPGSSYTMLDLQGRVVRAGSIRSVNETVAVMDLTPGTYLLRLNEMVPMRFIVAR